MFCLGCTLIETQSYLFAGLSFVGFIIGITGFIFIENRHPDPILPLFLLKNPVSDLFALNVMTFMIVVSVSWMLPQLEDQSSVVGLIQTIISVLSFVTSIILPFATKNIVFRYSLYVAYIWALFCMAIWIIFDLMSFYILTNMGLLTAMQILYSLTLMAAAPRYASKLSAFPTTSRTVGNSLGLCIFSSITQSICNWQQKIGKSHHDAFVIGSQISVIIMCILQLFMIVDAVFRLGNSRKELGKKGYKDTFIRELQEEEGEALLIKRSESLIVQKFFLKE
ncbi:Major_facilitator superfamily protein [Hexamita inflata]|nr:Major facilitator superfamily protein [Hexamita inflata]